MSSESPQPTQGAAALLLWSMDLDPLSSAQPTQGAAAFPLWTWTHCHLLSLSYSRSRSIASMDDLDPLSFAQPTHGAAGLPLYMDFDPRSFCITPAYSRSSSISLHVNFERDCQQTYMAPRYPCSDNSSPYLLFKEQHHCLGFLRARHLEYGTVASVQRHLSNLLKEQQHIPPCPLQDRHLTWHRGIPMQLQLSSLLHRVAATSPLSTLSPSSARRQPTQQAATLPLSSLSPPSSRRPRPPCSNTPASRLPQFLSSISQQCLVPSA